MSILTAQNFATRRRPRSSVRSRTRTRACCRGCASCARARSTPTTPSRCTPSAGTPVLPELGRGLRPAPDRRLPAAAERRIKKLSRGQLSAVGVIIGLASRAEITFFDEPYLGLDAVARQIFYDRLLEDYSEHPRTVILSSHLIDEVSNLIERVLVIDQGRIIMDETTDAVRDRASHDRRRRGGRRRLHRRARGDPSREPRPGDSVTVLGCARRRLDRARLASWASRPRPCRCSSSIVRLTQHAPASRRRIRPDRGGVPMNRTLNVVRSSWSTR